jgi:hypothetical protein
MECLQVISIIVSILTMGVIIWYASETRRMAKATRRSAEATEAMAEGTRRMADAEEGRREHERQKTLVLEIIRRNPPFLPPINGPEYMRTLAEEATALNRATDASRPAITPQTFYELAMELQREGLVVINSDGLFDLRDRANIGAEGN